MASYVDWTSLPTELLDLVSGHLPSERDLLHVRHVCAHWRASITARPAAPFRPWVLATRTRPDLTGPNGAYSLWLPRGVRAVAVAAPPGLPFCRGTPRGWLALADDKWCPTRLVLWDPRTGAEIPLPPMHNVVQVFLSGDPLASPPPASPGWTAVATHVTESMDHVLFFWRPGDAAWTPAARTESCNFFSTQNAAFLGGKMFCVESAERIAIYDLGEGAGAMASSPSPPVHLSAAALSKAHAAYFVAFHGDLLLVLLFRYRHPNSTRVYNLGPRGPSTRRPYLKLRKRDRVTDLGSYSLLLGRGDAFALSAEEYPAIRGNCIYYVDHMGVRKERRWASVFDLKSASVVEEIPFPPEHLENRDEQWWPCSWFCPEKPVLLKRHGTEL
ncbi:unnamed protein product [Urochloa decumbens]|uniref:DUF295 domain-containing protein n=1 Tax=Urochloa decumbens TaxID=240449 RepID=A0ABC8YDM8_9POAL